MNQLTLNSVAFPVRAGSLSYYEDTPGVWSWAIEIECDESPQLSGGDGSNDRPAQELDWLEGIEPLLYAQMLPIPATAPEELVGRTFLFPQTPEDDDPADWDRGVGWPFFCLYALEHDLAYPMTVTFVERRNDRYHVQIVGKVPCNSVTYELRADAWLDWNA